MPRPQSMTRKQVKNKQKIFLLILFWLLKVKIDETRKFLSMVLFFLCKLQDNPNKLSTLIPISEAKVSCLLLILFQQTVL